MSKLVFFDTEIMGVENPQFLICYKIEDGAPVAVWSDDDDGLDCLAAMIKSDEYTWVGFNSSNFDLPLIAALMRGADNLFLKEMADKIIRDEMKSWKVYEHFQVKELKIDHIDLLEVAPGTLTSLKTYAGRMNFPHLKDLPFEPDTEIENNMRSTVENYCFNDVAITEALFRRLEKSIELRVKMSREYGTDLRSKSDAQIAQTILVKRAGLRSNKTNHPVFVRYKAPKFIHTLFAQHGNKELADLLKQLEENEFHIDSRTGGIETPIFLNEPVTVGEGSYQLGIGGIHSLHDKKVCYRAYDDYVITDFDVASYYPNIMLKGGIVPDLGGKGGVFLREYEHIYNARIKAKREGDDVTNATLKIVLNGTFGKLGSPYCQFYAPELMLAVTITGQLNLLCIIEELEHLRDVSILSANTDGITVGYFKDQEADVQKVFADNAAITGFVYEETHYSTLAMKDVNNYIAVKTDGKLKRKGLYAPPGLMKNPTAPVCADAACAYLATGVTPEEYIPTRLNDHLEDFFSIRLVRGGGVQHLKEETINDWVLVDKGVWQNGDGKRVKRKSQPPARTKASGGEPFGRVARWYMTTEKLPPITYVSSGNTVPNTQGARIAMDMPAMPPADLNVQWYVDETWRILEDIGVIEGDGYEAPELLV